LTLTVDPEFSCRLPALSPVEFAQLEQNILADGCRDPLVAWCGVLLDGHNRFAICQTHGLPYKVESIDRPDRAAALAWIDMNALGTRNLRPDQITVILGRRYNALKKPRGGDRRSKWQNATLIGDTADTIAESAGVDPSTVKRAAKTLDSLTLDEQQAIMQGAATITKLKREKAEAKKESRRKENAAKVAATPDPVAAQARFATIVIDPPWYKGDEGDCDQMGRQQPTYATMPIGDIAALGVADLADTDCHLYLWITNRSLPKGFALLDGWGFRYITCITWVKPHFGLGNYFRGQTEHVLFGVRGSQGLKRKDAGTVFSAARGPNGHSSKPPEFLEFVESCSPGPYLEMFARSSRPGWTAWGADA